MNYLQMLDDEIARLQNARAILAGGNAPKRRGRPPKVSTEFDAGLQKLVMHEGGATKKGRRDFTPAQRRQQSERMRAYWAKKHAAAKRAARNAA